LKKIYTFTSRDYRQYSAVANLHTFQFTVTHALGFSVFTSRILATDLSQSQFQITHEAFFSQPNSLYCPYSATANSEDSTPNNSSAPKLISRQAGVSKLDRSLPTLLLCFYYLVASSVSFYNPSARTTQKTQPLLLTRRVTAPLPINKRPVVPRVCFCGNVFSESLPSNEYTRHNIHTLTYYPVNCTTHCL
jgi:hypothetical protein